MRTNDKHVAEVRWKGKGANETTHEAIANLHVDLSEYMIISFVEDFTTLHIFFY